jgi:enamine deaminase RidA (YjgF/YER057c/UK114 family)
MRGSASTRPVPRRNVPGLLLLAAVSACTIQERTDRVPAAASAPPDSATSEFISPSGASEPPRGVRSGDLIWIWGMPGTVPGVTPPQLVEGGAGAEARQALANIGEVLAHVGAEPRDLAQCSVFLADAADSAAVREAYLDYFGSPPTRTAIVAGGLALGARVEIECTIVLSGGV